MWERNLRPTIFTWGWMDVRVSRFLTRGHEREHLALPWPCFVPPSSVVGVVQLLDAGVVVVPGWLLGRPVVRVGVDTVSMFDETVRFPPAV